MLMSWWNETMIHTYLYENPYVNYFFEHHVVTALLCLCIPTPQMEGDLFCWNRKCMASPIFEEYFHKGDVDNDAGDVDMEESSDCIRKESVEEEEDDDGRLISSGTKNDKVSSTLSSTVMPKEPHNSFQHRTIIDPSVSYALCAPVKVSDKKPHVSVITLFVY